VRIYGSRVVTLVGGVTEHSGFFNEDTDTLILFPRGAVVRLSSSVAPGDLLTLTNLKTDREVVCRVASVKPSAGAKAYVEIEFSRPVPGFWGIDFPSDAPKPSSPPLAPAVTAEPKLKQHPVESLSSVRTAAPINASNPFVAAPPPEAFKPASVPVIPPAIVETKRREQTVESVSSSPTHAPVRESTTPGATPDAWKPSSERVIALTIVEPKGKEQPVESSSSASAASPPSASKAPMIAPPLSESILDVSFPSHVPPLPSAPITPGAIFEPMKKEQVVELASPVRAATVPASASSFDGPFRLVEAALDEQGPAEPGARARQARRTLVLVCSVSLLILVGVSGVAYYRRLSKSPVETTVSPTPITAARSDMPDSAASRTQLQPNFDSGAQPGAQGQPPTSTVASVKTEAKPPAERPQVPTPASKPAAPSKTPQTPAGSSTPRKLTLRAPMPAKMAVSGEEPPPLVVGEVPGGVPGNQASGALGGIVSRGGLTPTPLPPKAHSPGAAGGRVQPARLLSRVLPVYPTAAKQARIEGDVTLQADVDTAGNVFRTKVVSGPLPLQQAAMDALRQWKYEPSRLNDEPVATQVLVVIKFRIR